MLSLSEKSVISLPHRGGFNGRAFAIEPVHIRIEPILVELAKVLFQNILQRASFFGFLGFSFPHP
jgi:hypothetical protein